VCIYYVSEAPFTSPFTSLTCSESDGDYCSRVKRTKTSPVPYPRLRFAPQAPNHSLPPALDPRSHIDTPYIQSSTPSPMINYAWHNSSPAGGGGGLFARPPFRQAPGQFATQPPPYTGGLFKDAAPLKLAPLDGLFANLGQVNSERVRGLFRGEVQTGLLFDQPSIIRPRASQKTK
jgi:hypothetical protein